MKIIISLVILVNLFISYSQNIVVEKVKIIETIDKKYASEIPKVKNLLDKNNPVIKKINKQILDYFMINSFNQSEIEEFRWYGVSFDYEIKEDILYISISGTHYGAHSAYVEDKMYFDLKTGELLKFTIIPFQALFTLTGYLDFINKYWLKGVKKEFLDASECAGIKPYCTYYDISSYSVNGNKLSVSLKEDCYPYVSRACSPIFEILVELDSIKQYLNDIGKYILFESNYFSKSSIEMFLENERLKEKLPENFFIFGAIDNKYSFSMAININKDNQVSGYYYYNSKFQKIELNGEKII